MNLSSRNNPKIKQARQLKNRKQRDQLGLFLVEGIRHVGEAVEAGASIAYLIFAPELLTSLFAHQLIQKMENEGVECLAVAKDVFYGLTDKENPQGILAVVRQAHILLSRLNSTDHPWVVALVEPQDPGNIGTIMRTIDAVGASGLILIGESADVYHSTGVRASMGALFWYPIVQASWNEFSDWVRQNTYHVYGTSTHGSEDFRNITQYRQPLVLLLGSERQGLSPDQASACEFLIRLPMQGKATSLNLAVAAGVMLYEILYKLA